jgi:Cleavage site for pathogenic type III effector avirulence factor Avr
MIQPGEDQPVPKFGGWNYPNSGAGYDFTGQFQKVGEQRRHDMNSNAVTPPPPPPCTYQPQQSDPCSKERDLNQSYSQCRCVIL